MQCPNTEKLAAYQSGLLAASEHERMRLHLEECANCRHELSALQRTMQLLQADPSPVVPDALWAGVAGRLPVAPQRARGFRWWQVAASCGLAASLVLGFVASRLQAPAFPVIPAAAATYVTDHELLSAQDSLTDRASLGVMLASQRSSQ